MNYYIHHSPRPHVGNIEYFRVCTQIFTPNFQKTHRGTLCVCGKRRLVFILEPVCDEITEFMSFLKVVREFFG